MEINKKNSSTETNHSSLNTITNDINVTNTDHTGYTGNKGQKNPVLWYYCVKSVRIRSFSGPHFHAFGLNTERYGISIRIQSECEKIRNRTFPNTDTFHAVYI